MPRCVALCCVVGNVDAKRRATKPTTVIIQHVLFLLAVPRAGIPTGRTYQREIICLSNSVSYMTVSRRVEVINAEKNIHMERAYQFLPSLLPLTYNAPQIQLKETLVHLTTVEASNENLAEERLADKSH